MKILIQIQSEFCREYIFYKLLSQLSRWYNWLLKENMRSLCQNMLLLIPLITLPNHLGFISGHSFSKNRRIMSCIYSPTLPWLLNVIDLFWTKSHHTINGSFCSALVSKNKSINKHCRECCQQSNCFPLQYFLLFCVFSVIFLFKVLGSWETQLTNCSAMTVDTDAGHIAIGGTGGDMKNVIRIYDLKVRTIVFLFWGRGLVFIELFFWKKNNNRKQTEK